MDEALEDWFVREILPHEAALNRYLMQTTTDPADLQDFRQEVYVRVMEAAEKARPTTPRYFLFYMARNFLADQARKRRIVSIGRLQETGSSNDLVDELSPERRANGFQQLARLVEAFERLPDRCREVVWLKKVDQLSQREIAARLQITEGTVEAHMVRGMRLLVKLFHSQMGEAQDGNDRRVEREA